MSKGLFVTFEGGEGSGKTTILSHLVNKLNECNIDFITTREPGGCEISEQIRKVILDTENTEMNKRTEALLYAASRAQHVEQILKPAILEGKLVLCDRYVDSSIIYQGFARGNNIDEIWSINNFAMEGLLPDLTIFLDINPDEAFKRLNDREMNRLDLEEREFHHKVYDKYLELAKADRVVIVDANRSIEEIVEEVFKVILEKYEEACE